jgi:arylsulfatase
MPLSKQQPQLHHHHHHEHRKVLPFIALLFLLLAGTFWQVGRSVRGLAPDLYKGTDNLLLFQTSSDEASPDTAVKAGQSTDDVAALKTSTEEEDKKPEKAVGKDDTEESNIAAEVKEEAKEKTEVNTETNEEPKEEETNEGSNDEISGKKEDRDGEEEEESAEIEPKKKKKPLNVVIFYPDDWRHDSIGGVAPIVRTPFLNELASEGIRFTHNQVTTSICWISRATLFTGQYVSRHKSSRLRTTEFYKTWNTSWPGLLREHGYYTGHVGKWQYMNPDHYVEKNLFNHTNLFEGSHWFRGKHACDKTRDDTIAFLQNRPKDRPFSVTAAFYPPKAVGMSHVPGGQWTPKNETRAKYYDNETIPTPPYDVEESYKKLPWFFHVYEKEGRYRWNQRFNGTEKYQAAMKNYYSLVTEVDQACREIVDELKRQGILDETLIIFTTDNGLFHSEHGLAGKWYPYQESIRVPLIVRDPRMPEDQRNKLRDELTLNIDLAPTVLGAAGIEVPSTMQGRDFAELYLPANEDEEQQQEGSSKKNQKTTTIADLKPWRTEFYYEFPSASDRIMPSNSAVVRHDIKYIYWPRYKFEQLFNLTEDALEQDDVVNKTEYASILKELRVKHEKYKKEVK